MSKIFHFFIFPRRVTCRKRTIYFLFLHIIFALFHSKPKCISGLCCLKACKDGSSPLGVCDLNNPCPGGYKCEDSNCCILSTVYKNM